MWFLLLKDPEGRRLLLIQKNTATSFKLHYWRTSCSDHTLSRIYRCNHMSTIYLRHSLTIPGSSQFHKLLDVSLNHQFMHSSIKNHRSTACDDWRQCDMRRSENDFPMKPLISSMEDRDNVRRAIKASLVRCFMGVLTKYQSIIHNSLFHTC